MLLISACSSLVHLDEDEKSKRWNNHLVQINKVESWSMIGRVSVKNLNESATFKLQWEQNNSDYELRLISAFGQGTFLINGSDKGINIQTPKNKIFPSVGPCIGKNSYEVDIDFYKKFISKSKKNSVYF